MGDDSDSDQDIRKQRSLSETPVTAQTGVSQADRIIDKISDTKEEIQKINRLLSSQDKQINELDSKLDDLDSKQYQIEDDIKDIEEELERELESIQNNLVKVSENAGINLPAGARHKITVPIGISLLAFSIISGGIAVLHGASIPLRAQVSTAATIGLLSLEIIEYIR